MTAILLGFVIGVLLIFGFVVFFGAPYVPAKMSAVRRAFDELYSVGPGDVLLDLGSGDGRIVREAARRGARAEGFEINPVLVLIASILSPRKPNAVTRLANIWTSKFPDQTTVIYVFVESRDAKRLVRKIQNEATRLDRSLYVLSFAFELDAPLLRRNNLHFLYEIHPLHSEKHKV